MKSELMNLKRSRLAALISLSIVFTIALTFATLELPRLLNIVLRNYFPDIYYEPESIQALMNFARPIGYAALIVLVAMIVVGFATERRRLSSLGSFAFFLPTFGYFAASMFFLTGIGILRVIWLPFWDSSASILRLGDIVYLPFWIIKHSFSFLGDRNAYTASSYLAYLFLAVGLLLFCIGTFTWLYGRFEKRKIFDFWIYRYSRHPQYFGFILWSYGVMLLASIAPYPFGGFQPQPTLPWLISTLLVVFVALKEEMSMVRRADEAYKAYRKRSSFMLPLPGFLSKIITAPNRILLRKGFPENGKEILYSFAIYLAILTLTSLPLALLTTV